MNFRFYTPLFGLLLLTACARETAPAADPIPGGPSDKAADTLAAVGPVLAEDSDLAEDGRIKTRIVVLLHPSATVEAVNSALAEGSLSITHAAPPSLVVSLSTPVQEDRS